MSPLVFLLLAVGMSVLGGVALWVRQRPPRSYDAGIKEFRREMAALAPPDQGTDNRRRRWPGRR